MKQLVDCDVFSALHEFRSLRQQEPYPRVADVLRQPLQSRTQFRVWLLGRLLRLRRAVGILLSISDGLLGLGERIAGRRVGGWGSRALHLRSPRQQPPESPEDYLPLREQSTVRRMDTSLWIDLR